MQAPQYLVLEAEDAPLISKPAGEEPLISQDDDDAEAEADAAAPSHVLATARPHSKSLPSLFDDDDDAKEPFALSHVKSAETVKAADDDEWTVVTKSMYTSDGVDVVAAQDAFLALEATLTEDRAVAKNIIAWRKSLISASVWNAAADRSKLLSSIIMPLAVRTVPSDSTVGWCILVDLVTNWRTQRYCEDTNAKINAQREAGEITPEQAAKKSAELCTVRFWHAYQQMGMQINAGLLSELTVLVTSLKYDVVARTLAGPVASAACMAGLFRMFVQLQHWATSCAFAPRGVDHGVESPLALNSLLETAKASLGAATVASLQLSMPMQLAVGLLIATYLEAYRDEKAKKWTWSDLARAIKPWRSAPPEQHAWKLSAEASSHDEFALTDGLTFDFPAKPVFVFGRLYDRDTLEAWMCQSGNAHPIMRDVQLKPDDIKDPTPQQAELITQYIEAFGGYVEVVQPGAELNA